MFSITLPIVWLLKDGQPTDDTEAGDPCVSLLFTVGTLVQGYDVSICKPIIALVDTGCNYPVVDMALSAGAPVVQTVSSTSVDTIGTQDVCYGSFVFAGAQTNHAFSSRFARMPLAGTVPYRMILDRSLLKYCELRYFGRRAEGKLIVFPN